ncbi:H+-ATPase subunit E/Vma4 [Peptoclostridium litorale DSM 5388]|uniref:V-type proton ATPase subunit E n=1 Tax=Peptoclostridium litorale DSM 5388 TaxID=1121324 RepID=A0A069RCN0_PEPLI|nr:V-type ATP synthase subunit E family protein [Peptoclostridium litorale]KDR94781.1 hypothetical protein CLIT_13c01030 [Peptoclostridium litorale DSM 5388]SIN92555.1 H+-ATPase subunit E/Vma4 [Peptoclostridium litorale DSM 5388]
MITLEDKLELFTKMVYEKLHTDSEWKLKKMKEENERRLLEKKAQLTQQAEEIYEDLLQRGELKKSEIISQAQTKGRKKTLLKLNEFVDIIVGDIYAMGGDFTKGQEYEDFLYSRIRQAFDEIPPNGGVVIYIRDEDRQMHMGMIEKAIKDSGGDVESVKFGEMQPGCIGGVIMQDENGFFRIDSSIASIIEESRDMVGRLVYEYLGEKGDLNER